MDAPPRAAWLILPAYNEAGNLPPLLRRVEAAQRESQPFRVLVVDDGSTDGTAAAAKAAGHLPVEIVTHERNQGLAAAVRTGIGQACARAGDEDAIVIMDADNSHPPELIEAMIAKLDAGYDIVIASRFVRGGRQEGVPWPRRVLSRAASLMFRVTWPMRGVRDYTTGFRAYRARFLKKLWGVYGDHLVEATAFAVMTEILVKSRSLGARIAEVPLVLRYDFKKGPSKMRLARTLRDYLRLLGRNLRPRSGDKAG